MMDSERGNFVVYFDQALYEAPQIILNLEIELEKKEQEQIDKNKKPGYLAWIFRNFNIRN